MKRFQGTTFFPKKDDVVSCMNQCIDSGLPVFARDTGFGATKSYFACGFEYFCNVLYRNRKRYSHVYELLQYDLPAKCYMDFDHDDVSHKDEFEESVDKFVNTLRRDVLNDETCKVYVLDACTDRKLSKHVIVNFVLPNIAAVENAVAVTKERTNCQYVDMTVYSRNRLFRLLYSYKHGKGVESALKCGGNTYEPQLVFETLVQAYASNASVARTLTPVHGPIRYISNLRRASRNNNNNTRGLSSIGHFELLNFVTDYGGASIASVKENDHFISSIVQGKECPWKGAVHKGNHQFLVISKSTLRAWFRCSDQDCPDAPYDHADVTFLWNKEALSWNCATN